MCRQVWKVKTSSLQLQSKNKQKGIVICFPLLTSGFRPLSCLALSKHQIKRLHGHFTLPRSRILLQALPDSSFAVALKSPKQAINNSRCAKHTAAMIRLIQLCWTMFGKWTSAEYSTCRWHCTSSSPWTCKKPNKSISESEHKI